MPTSTSHVDSNAVDDPHVAPGVESPDNGGSVDQNQTDTGASSDKSEEASIISTATEEPEEKPQLGPASDRAKHVRRYAHYALIFLGFCALVHALYFARSILIPITLAFLLFFLLSPLVRFLSRFRFMNESLAAAMIVVAFSTVTIIGSYFLTGPITTWVREAPSTFRAAEEKLRFIYEPFGMLDDATENVNRIAQPEEDEDVVKVAIQQPPLMSYLLDSTVTVFAGTIVTIVFVYLLLAGGHRSLNSIVELMPSVQDKKGLVSMLRDIEQGISSYLLTITLINICLGIVIGTVLGLLGLPDPWLLGIMACLLNFIPFAGAAVGAAIVFVISVVSLETPLEIAMGPLLYFCINSLEGNLITPVILGRSMKLNPAIVFLCIIFWGWIWGIGGVLLSVPIIGILKISFSHFKHLRPLAHILTG
ncbi:MAG: hypothetical protein CMJ46_06010 [Planctomyces sp.]|nr:hypothetical protein [Planctomyces sp.]